MAASPSQLRLPDSPASVLAVLNDDLLAEFLIRLPTLSDVGRACTVCVAFRRVISGHSFLRRLRALHPPPLLGILSMSFVPAAPPHPCAALARSITPAALADFGCRFVPSPDRWSHRDFHDGRALLAAIPERSCRGRREYDPRTLVREFAVCDPLHRRYLLLPTIPEDLTAQLDVVWCTPFLAPSEEGEGGTSFRVIYLAQCKNKLVHFTFSSVSGSWHAAEFDGWRALIAESSNPAPAFQPEFNTRYYAHGCFCWVMNYSHKLLVLNMRTMGFSAFDIPLTQIQPTPDRAIVEAGEGKFGMFTLSDELAYEEYELVYSILQNDGNGTVSWQPEALIPLPLNYRYSITGVAGGYLLLQGTPVGLYSFPASERPNIKYLSVNLKTLGVELFCETQDLVIFAPSFVCFPPSLSAPTV